MSEPLAIDFFFYGTLLDADVREQMLGIEAAQHPPRPAILKHYSCVTAAAGQYPILRRHHNCWVQGILLGGFDEAAIHRLGYFEGEQYRPQWLTVREADGRRTRAIVFLPWRGRIAVKGPWNLRHWQLRQKPRVMLQMRVWTQEFGAVKLRSIGIPWHIRRRLFALIEHART